MREKPKLRNSLVTKLLLSVGAVLLVSLGLWGYFNVQYTQRKMIQDQASNMERLSNTIRLGTHYAMMLNSRDDIRQIIANIARQNEIESIRVYNKEGRIKFSNRPEEVDRQTNIRDEACFICHNTDPPLTTLSTSQRIRIFSSERGYRLMGIIGPVYNEVGCSAGACHVHPSDKQVLGAIDVVISFKEMDEAITTYQRNLIFLAAILVCGTAIIIVRINVRFVTRPIRQLVDEARRIENGENPTRLRIEHKDEMQQMADALYQMGQAITDKTQALNRQCDQYLNLFETVPCIITVQDRDYRLIGYNHEFAEKFHPREGDHCYQAYKGRECKCVVCPVEQTFIDGMSHHSEESAVDKDGTVKHWIVRTSPVKDAEGRVVAAMEMNLDITESRQLQEKLVQSEKKYQDIFNAIANPVFVLHPGSLTIMDCNDSVEALYGFRRAELVGSKFDILFWEPSDARQIDGLTTDRLIERAKHRSKDNYPRYVIIRLSTSEYDGQAMLLATVNDITQRLETEQQLIQASKMATLGEMATGVAHELNQPLSVIKTASSYFMRKLRNHQPIPEEILLTMAEEIDTHVQRATKIIGHMRQFGRKVDPNLEKVQINDVLRQAFDMFSQQLKVHGIEVIWNIQTDLPRVLGDAGRLEQVMINLLLNARDAIEEKWQGGQAEAGDKQILLSTARLGDHVAVWVCDTGIGVQPGISDKIFEPFYTTKKVGQGTGLGLSISYGIVKECNGDIYTRPNPGGGACFVMKFPIPVDES